MKKRNLCFNKTKNLIHKKFPGMNVVSPSAQKLNENQRISNEWNILFMKKVLGINRNIHSDCSILIIQNLDDFTKQ